MKGYTAGTGGGGYIDRLEKQSNMVIENPKDNIFMNLSSVASPNFEYYNKKDEGGLNIPIGTFNNFNSPESSNNFNNGNMPPPAAVLTKSRNENVASTMANP